MLHLRRKLFVVICGDDQCLFCNASSLSSAQFTKGTHLDVASRLWCMVMCLDARWPQLGQVRVQALVQ